MVGRGKKRPPPRPRGLPNQQVSPPRRTESPPSRRSPRRSNSPPAGNKGDFGNINVSPNDQSLDSQANHDVASDSVVPEFAAAHLENDNEDVTLELAQPDFDSLDPYEVLGVPQQATNRQIKKTYFKLCKQYHPDRLTSLPLPNQQDAHNKFTLISNAYEFLMDPDKRREHDLILRMYHTIINNATNNVNDEDSLSEEEKVFGKCHWSHIVSCNLPHLKPLQCTFDGCNNLVHHHCQIAFEEREGCSQTMSLKCCLHHPQSPFMASKPPFVDDTDEKLHSSTVSNSKTSMAVSSGHPNEGEKKAAGKAASSLSDESSSSDDSSDDSSNDRKDGISSAPTPARGKNLAFQTRYGQGKQVRLGAPSADDSSEDSSTDRKDGARSATTPARGKDQAFQSRLMKAKKLRPELPTAKNRSTKFSPRDMSQCVYFDAFTSYARHQLPEDIDEILTIVESVISNKNVTTKRFGSTNRMSRLNSEVSNWNAKRPIFPSSSSIFNDSIGDDGLSSQSTYDVRIDNPHHIEAIAPNSKLLQDSLPTIDAMKTSYQILLKAVNEMRIQLSTKNTLSAIDRNGRTFNTNIAEIHATSVCLSIDDVEFYEWASENKFARFWYCQDLRHSEILKLSIENAIKKSPLDVLQRCLFRDNTDGQCDQFVGFVSSHTTGKIVDAFHLHSFAVFHTTKGKDTIVTCMLTARNHILSNMQDRVFQVMQLIQFRKYSTFSTSITNNFIGVDVQLSKMSLNGYESMGFDVRSLTQDRDQDLFTITTQKPIPLAVYDDRYTWAKYGRLIIPEVLKHNDKQNFQILGTYRIFLRQFLRIDVEGKISKILDVATKSKISDYLSSLFEGSETPTREETFHEYVKTAKKKEMIIKKVREIAVSATSIPLSIFTNLFHQRFSKHVYLESTLELLQQFYIEMNSCHERYCLIPGDQCKYTLKCVRCHKNITAPGTIGETLYHAPISMLYHWEMIDYQDHRTNPPVDFDITHVPLLCSGMDSFQRAQASFQATLTDRGNKVSVEVCFSKGDKEGELEFCEAVKVDVSKRKEASFQANISTTVALISAIFEDVGVAIELHDRAKKIKKSEEAFPSGHSILFNETFEFEKGFLEKEFNAVQKECLKTLESLCVFGYREFYKNLLCILVEMHHQIYRKYTPVPKPMMEMFGVFNAPLVAHMSRRRTFEITKFSQAYRMDNNSSHLIVGNSVTRPVQFSLGALPTEATFTDKRGIGWNSTNVADFFHVSSSDDDNGGKLKEQKMITSKQFEAHHIMLWTMRHIKVTKMKNSDKKLFHVQCHTKTYQYGDAGIRKRHPTIFKEDTFSFTPIDELVLSMPFQFIRTLKVGTWTPIDRNWLQRLHKHLSQADNNSIKQVRFIRRIITNNWKKGPQEYEDENEKYIYKIYTPKGENYFVNVAQIHDIIGDEVWFLGETKCLCNIASDRFISLSWGAKKKESTNSNETSPSNSSCPGVGDHVIVSNHGSKWEHRATIVKIILSTSSAVVKWDTTLKKDTVDLADCTKYDVDEVSDRKRKATDFYQNSSMNNQMSKKSMQTPPGQMLNMFYSRDNLGKLCAEGAIRNLMNVLHCSPADMTSFWNLATSSLHSILATLNEVQLPRAVIGGSFGIDSIEKCLWILRKKFNFATTSKLKVSKFQSLKLSLNALFNIKFPMLISVQSIQATYKHVVVVWRNKIIDFESMHTYPLTEESLRQVCGVHTTFQRIVSGCGIFPSKKIRNSTENAYIKDWGMDDYYKKGGSVREYFMCNK